MAENKFLLNAKVNNFNNGKRTRIGLNAYTLLHIHIQNMQEIIYKKKEYQQYNNIRTKNNNKKTLNVSKTLDKNIKAPRDNRNYQHCFTCYV